MAGELLLSSVCDRNKTLVFHGNNNKDFLSKHLLWLREPNDFSFPGQNAEPVLYSEREPPTFALLSPFHLSGYQ